MKMSQLSDCLYNAQWAKQAVDVSVLISVKNIWLLDNKIFLANGVQKYFIYF